jgi:hypothetical protein
MRRSMRSLRDQPARPESPAAPQNNRLSSLRKSTRRASSGHAWIYETPISQPPNPSGFPMDDRHMDRGPVTPLSRPTPAMLVETHSADWSERMVREWLLLLLRFAVTRQPADRSAAFSMAEQLDSLGTRRPPDAAPRFFRRASDEVCQAIVAAGDESSNVVLRRHIARIDHPRLRRAFQAVVGIAPMSRTPKNREDKRRKTRDLFKGISSG